MNAEANPIAQIQAHAERVFDSKAKADAWLDKPLKVLGGIRRASTRRVKAASSRCMKCWIAWIMVWAPDWYRARVG